MAKKAKTDEVKLEFKTSEDMMSLETSDGRKFKAVAQPDYRDGCKGCGLSLPNGDMCDYNVEDTRCSPNVRHGNGVKLKENIIWVEDKAIKHLTTEKIQASLNGPESIDIISVMLNLIDQSPFQVRTVDVESESFKELVSSVVSQGLINPLTVRFVSETGRYELIAGHRRFRACEVAGMLTAPCFVKSASDAQAEAMTCCENLNREDLLPIDEALTVRAMLDHGRTREEIAKITGKSTRWVYRREAAARIGEEWIKLAREHKLSSKFLEFIGSIDEETRATALDAVKEDDDLLQDGGDIDDVEWRIDLNQRRLRVAPWAGTFDWCQNCEKRSDKCQTMDGNEDEYSAYCLDGACWKINTERFPEAVIQRYREEGVEIRETTMSLSDIDLMDLNNERDEDYDVCIVNKDPESNEQEVYWARSKPAKPVKNAKPVERKPTEENLLQAAFVDIVKAHVVKCKIEDVFDGNEYKWVMAAMVVGINFDYPSVGASGYPSADRARKLLPWIEKTGAWDIERVFVDNVMASVNHRLEIYSPFDTVSSYSYAKSLAAAFTMEIDQVEKQAQERVAADMLKAKSAGKKKAKK
jgi:ParB/RepB/Spo0J family partition protein